MQKTRMRYARSSQRLLTRTTAPVGALATSMNINYSDRDEMPRIPALFPVQLVAPLLDRCRLQQPICKFARSLCLLMAGWKRVARIVTVEEEDEGDLEEERGKGVIENRERGRGLGFGRPQ
ncbi:hypothetical protein ALC57_00918 [Trachymyrmex cornetzi]|uniref:Uncharacterized protein n=1 Tax=Trachymyrmex cornetzi TaxID=471704 RepID=A0A195EMZ7_9HYME|nr:hypothetical protein ALC57_00918 [Trachymyrmex cornetzi]